MDEPPAKRIRTSPPDDRARTSSPLKKAPRRPSYSSPTKASLARFNPNLLPRQSATASKPDDRGGILNRGKRVLSYIMGGSEEEQPEPGSRIEAGQDEESLPTVAGAEQQRASNAQNVTPRARRTDRRIKVPLGQLQEEEAELPTSPLGGTSSRPDTPRRGVLWSSPSKRPPRARSTAAASPLQKRTRDETVRKEVAGPEDGTEGQNGDQVDQSAQKPKQAFDPEVQKKKHERDRLLNELRDLEKEVASCTRVIKEELDRPAAQILHPRDRDYLITLINKLANVEEAAEEQAPAVTNLLCSFLPFTAGAIKPPKPTTQDKPVPSHRPLELDDPLPYLQMFTNFKFTTHISLPTNYDPSQTPAHQIHTIDVAGPLNLLTCTITATSNTSTSAITSLAISRLPPWTSRDLSPFTALRARENDLSTLCWSLTSYWSLAHRRAQFWHACESAFAHLLPGRTASDTENATPKTDKRAARPPPPLSRKDLHRHLGRDVLVLEDAHVLLKVSWRIGFDWTGEAESEVGVEPAFPAVWTRADKGGGLGKIPKTFRDLLGKRGAFEATRMMVALLFGGD